MDSIEEEGLRRIARGVEEKAEAAAAPSREPRLPRGEAQVVRETKLRIGVVSASPEKAPLTRPPFGVAEAPSRDGSRLNEFLGDDLPPGGVEEGRNKGAGRDKEPGRLCFPPGSVMITRTLPDDLRRCARD